MKALPNRLPAWLRKNLAPGHEAAQTDTLIKTLGLHTICESGRCPNRDECYSRKAATFMLMGDICTRACGFCSVSTGRPGALDDGEPGRVAEAVEVLGLEHVVITSVNRDDLPDEGARHFAGTIEAIKKVSGEIIIEILTPDFRRTQGRAIEIILDAGPDIFNHNTETVPRLYPRVRPQGDYGRSLNLLREIRRRAAGVLTKSGLMLGLGETRAEVREVLRDLRNADCDMLTLGQYLQSSAAGLPVEEYVPPAVFSDYKEEAKAMGFKWVESAPFVRSSYHARESFETLKSIMTRKGG